MIARVTRLVLLILTACLLAGCGGGGNSTPPAAPAQSAATTGTVKGVIYAPDGTTPVPGALVYVPGAVARSRAVTTPEPSIASAITDAAGAFQLSGIPAGTATLKVIMGGWKMTRQVSVVASRITSLPAATTTLPSTPSGGDTVQKMAVVTGWYDRMQDVLAKLGMGDIDANGTLILGTQQFDLYDGGDSQAGASAPTMSTLLNDPTKMAKYSIIFINCGADDENITPTVAANLRTFVNNGGKLYASCYAYDFVEQAFPQYIDFYGSDTTPAASPEDLNTGEVASDVTANGEVLDSALRANLATYANTLNQDGTITIHGMWVVMNSVAPNTKTWVRGNMTWDVGYYPASTRSASHVNRPQNRSRASGVVPLSVTFDHGSGRVLYTCYHTVDEPSPTLAPQERILVYLAFVLTSQYL